MVDIEVGGSRTLNMSARANPAAISYSWNRLGAPLSKPVIEDTRRALPPLDPFGGSLQLQQVPRYPEEGVVADGPILYLRKVKIENGGDYELEAANKEGVTVSKIHVNVQCKYFAIAFQWRN